jgi:hypothetical protein
MPRTSSLILGFLYAAILIGCSKAQRTDNDTLRTPNSNAANSVPIGSAIKIGNPECDDFVAKYLACVTDHVPEAKQLQYREYIQAWSKSRRQQIIDAAPSEEVTAACKRQSIQAREAMKPFGCEF